MKRNFSIVLVVAMIQWVSVSTSFSAPIHAAAGTGNLAEVTRLIAKDRANLEAADRSGWTPLHYAAVNGHIAVVQALIAKGANVEADDEIGWTPLHVAVSGDHIASVQALLAHGADVNALNRDGRTPLQIAQQLSRAAIATALQPQAIAQLHTQTADAHTAAGNHRLAARSHTWAAEALPGTEEARVSHTRAAESHLQSENYEAALESYTLAGILPADIHTLVAEYLSTNPHGLDSEAVADRHVRAMLSHMSAADIHHAGGNGAGVELALAAAELSRAQAMVSYDQAAVNADEEIQRTEKIPAARLVLADHAMEAGNHSLARKVLRQRTHSLVFKAAQVVRARRIGSKLETLNSGYAERLTRLGRH